ncbi:hypothetical protein AQJ46_49045 [Streptomyces canus]|uniref:Uncharacterized protein n=1 Tax=Streptomyces canus TaxID=58343 RepID=A0A117QVY5_9ACTN|nr:hypothetical protein AQJ46_49045 [Streptomyces canus]
MRRPLDDTHLSTAEFTTRVLVEQAEAESCWICRTPHGPAEAWGLDQLRQALLTAAGTVA